MFSKPLNSLSKVPWVKCKARNWLAMTCIILSWLWTPRLMLVSKTFIHFLKFNEKPKQQQEGQRQRQARTTTTIDDDSSDDSLHWCSLVLRQKLCLVPFVRSTPRSAKSPFLIFGQLQFTNFCMSLGKESYRSWPSSSFVGLVVLPCPCRTRSRSLDLCPMRLGNVLGHPDPLPQMPGSPKDAARLLALIKKLK